jgi:hypothetical protein
MDCEEAVQSVAAEAETIDPEMLADGTLITCCGSGVTPAGLLRGLRGSPARVIGVSSGRSIARIEECLKRYVSRFPPGMELYPATLPYSDPAVCPCPFATDAYYDLKAWQHLVDHLDSYPDPILFWNVGA